MSHSAASRLLPLLQQHNLAAYIVLSDDAHASEYVAECDKRRQFISGFTGSAGTALLLNPLLIKATAQQQKHRLWTDGRYYTQAEQELSDEWQLMRAGSKDVPKLEDFLTIHLPPNSVVGVDASTVTTKQYKLWHKALTSAEIELRAMPSTENLIDQIWNERPPRPANQVKALPFSLTGQTVEEKLSLVRAKMAKSKCFALVVAALDEVAYLLNLRGADISYNPVFFSYAIVTNEEVLLFIDEKKLDPDARKQLDGSRVRIRPYDAMWSALRELKPVEKSKIWLDPDTCSQAIFSAVSAEVHEAESPLQLMKACKNEAELKGMKTAHIQDAIAVIEFLCWLENELVKKQNQMLDECSAADKLEQFRSQRQNFVGLSFDTISSIGSNAAIIHYKPCPEKCKKLDTQHVYLLDSGGQYLTGTTDITRTMHFGQPTEYEKECFTYVLKGHIQLALATFPQGTVGPMIDAFARQALWAHGLDYQHGTGHGVGCYLNVHEGPMAISSSIRSASVANTALAPGMCLSNEPGYYEPGQNGFGIRIESIVTVIPKMLKYNYPKDKQYLGFETITLVPIQQKMINKDLLTPEEKRWLNDYHKEIREKIGKYLTKEAKDWLHKETAPIQ